jgi:hypothetical protein
MKKIIMRALAALTISESNILASSLLTQTSTYYQDGGAMKDDRIMYTMPDGVTQYFVDRAGNCYKVNSSSTTAITYTPGTHIDSQNALALENTLRNIDDGALVNDAAGFETLFFWTVGGNYLLNALYQKKTGTIVNNIKKLFAADSTGTGTVSYDQWEPVYGDKISATDFVAAMNNTVDAGGCSVALTVYTKNNVSSPANVVFNMLMSTATDGSGNYWKECSVSTLSSSSALGTFNFGGKTYYVTGTSTTAADYTVKNSTLPSGVTSTNSVISSLYVS